jgi:hypothetical protein
MIGWMATLALLAGSISSYYLAVIRFRQLVLVVYHIPFRFWQPYTALYDALEDRSTYELLGGKERFKSHKAFLSMYRDKRSIVTGQFRSLWNAYAKQVGRDYGLVLLVALGLFWSVFWAFIIPFLVIQLVTFLRLHLVQNYRADFFAILLVSLMLSEQHRAL